MGPSERYSVCPALACKAEARRRQQWRERSRSIFQKHRRIALKKFAISRSSKRSNNGVKRKIKTLQKLVPNGKSNGLEALFTEAADYIKCLQIKVNVMKLMVNLLSPSD
ncbi:putative Transcription factor [Melia azedarach]|uniref:Transcription factor n=1 Tax=Melia azedarach TaxID=155640 RepID=A0ACC1YDX6_MELAZ|nr:putative Transcription factor [Melia azedarach]